MKKKIILVLIILIPSLIYFLFELSEANFKKMAYYGPKSVDAKGDSVYYTLPDEAFALGEARMETSSDSSGNKKAGFVFDSKKEEIKNSKKAFVAIFIESGQEDKLGGLFEYERYKKEKLKKLEINIVRDLYFYPADDSTDWTFLEKNGIHIYNTSMDSLSFDKTRALYFNQKPVHVFTYFAALVDKDHHIRGYYDPTYISEVKRMIEEYEHLVLKDEHAEMQEKNAIEKK